MIRAAGVVQAVDYSATSTVYRLPLHVVNKLNYQLDQLHLSPLYQLPTCRGPRGRAQWVWKNKRERTVPAVVVFDAAIATLEAEGALGALIRRILSRQAGPRGDQTWAKNVLLIFWEGVRCA